MLLEVKQHRTMWIVGFVTSLVYVLVFFFAKIYADMGLQLYYVVISVYGFWLWNRTTNKPVEEASPSGEVILYRHITILLIIVVIIAIVVVYFAIYYILANFTDSPVPIGDAFTTSVGIVATWMLARRIVEHWYFWIIANIVSIYIYYLRDLYPTMFLYLCYTILSIVGLYLWLKNGKETDDNAL